MFMHLSMLLNGFSVYQCDIWTLKPEVLNAKRKEASFQNFILGNILCFTILLFKFVMFIRWCGYHSVLLLQVYVTTSNTSI
jgi:hypothetical protein